MDFERVPVMDLNEIDHNMANLKSSPGPMSLGPGETYFENDWPHGCKDLADQINLTDSRTCLANPLRRMMVSQPQMAPLGMKRTHNLKPS